MRILVTPIGSAGDNYPLIGIGRELARRGHEVIVVTVEPFERAVRQCGLGYHQIGTAAEFRANIANPDLWSAARGFATVMQMSAVLHDRLLAAMKELIVPGRTLVVGHVLDFVSRSLAERDGLPVVTIHFAPTVVRSMHEIPMTGPVDLTRWPRWAKRIMWRLADGVLIDPAAEPVINRVRRQLGMGRVRRPFASWIHSPLLTVAMWPEWFGHPQPDWPKQIHCAGFPLFEPESTVSGSPDEGLEAFLKSGSPPLVFTPGSANIHARGFLAAAVGACRILGRRGLLLTTHAEQVPRDLPADVMHHPYAPLTRMLPRCALLAHPGGIGTVAAGLAAGVPQVVLPLAHDQPDNAERVRRLGAGATLRPQRMTAERFANAIRPLLGDAVRDRCREIAGWCAKVNGIATACDMIESVVPYGEPVRSRAG